MLHNGCAIKAGNTYGVVQHLDHAVSGKRWWQVRLEDGREPVLAEDDIIDVEYEEWQDALHRVTDSETCLNFNDRLGRRCGLRAGHRTTRHRNCELSWE